MPLGSSLSDGVYLLPVLIPSPAESVGDYIKLASPLPPSWATPSPPSCSPSIRVRSAYLQR